MLVKDLIKVLQVCDPESRVEVTFERADIYRMDMIKRCIKIGNPKALTQMEIDGVLLEEGIQGEDEHTVSCILYAAVRKECL